MRQRMTPEQIVSEVKQSPAAKVKVAVADLDGVLRGKTIHRDKFLSAVEKGFGFCNVIFGWDCNDAAYDNVQYTGWHTGYPDAQAHIDLSTFRKVPWDNDLPLFIADFVDAQGGPLAVCPRSGLKKAIGKAEAMGLSPLFGMEFEWFNFRETPQSLRAKSFVQPEPLTPGMFGYSLLRTGLNQGYVNALFDDLRAFDVPVEGLHTETGPGVFEAAILYSDALEAADRGLLFKGAVKEIGYRFGVIASFMAKWHADLPGSGGHMHQSLVDAHGQNVFYDAAGEHGMSTLFRHYLAGQMHCLPHLTPLYAPTINSYKRLVEGAWAPTRVTWGADNRTAALRVITGGPKATRLETRVSGADINPYLAVTAALASGLYGIEHRLELPGEAVVGNAYVRADAPQLPRTLQEAAEKMATSKVARDVLGAPFVEHFANSRLWEWRQAQKAVTNWELERYFEII